MFVWRSNVMLNDIETGSFRYERVTILEFTAPAIPDRAHSAESAPYTSRLMDISRLKF